MPTDKLSDCFNHAINTYVPNEIIENISSVPLLNKKSIASLKAKAIDFFGAVPAYDENNKPNYLDDKGNVKDGIYLGLENAVYHLLPCLNSSKLKAFSESPAHYYRNYVDESNSRVITKSLQRCFDAGTYTHELILEREGFEDRYFRLLDLKDFPDAINTVAQLKTRCEELGIKTSGSKSDLITRIIDIDPNCQIFEHLQQLHIKHNVGTTAYQTALNVQSTSEEKISVLDALKHEIVMKVIKKVPVEPMVWDKSFRSCTTVRNNEFANQILSNGQPEVTVIVTCKITGMKLKVRFDWLGNNGVPADVKSTRSCHFRRLAYQFSDLKYDLQAAFYTYCGRLAGIPIPEYTFPFVCVQTEAADICEVVVLSQSDFQSAEKSMKHNLLELQDCIKEDNWYGYSKGGVATMLKLPRSRVN